MLAGRENREQGRTVDPDLIFSSSSSSSSSGGTGESALGRVWNKLWTDGRDGLARKCEGSVEAGEVAAE